MILGDLWGVYAKSRIIFLDFLIFVLMRQFIYKVDIKNELINQNRFY